MERFQIGEFGVTHSDKRVIPWSQMTGLRKPIFSKSLVIKGQEDKVCLDLTGAPLKEFLFQFFNEWRRRDPDAAKKNAFDYVDSRKGFAKVQLVVSILFCLGFACLLTVDVLGQRRCSSLLQAESKSASAEIIKLKKKRAGHYILNLKFRTDQGQEVSGQDQIIEQESEPEPKSPIAVVYSPADTSCWSITKAGDSTQADWARRRFFTSYLLLFGAFFWITGLAGTVTAIARLREERPFTKEIADLFGLDL